MSANQRGRTTPGEGPTRVAIAGLGSVGRALASHLLGDQLSGYKLVAASARREWRAREFLSQFDVSVRVPPVSELADHADVVVECAPAAVFPDVASPVVAAGKRLVVISAGALLESWYLTDRAKETGAQILVPTGALLGLDAIQGLAQGSVSSVRMVSHKPPDALHGAPYLEEREIDLEDVKEPLLVFRGNAREAVNGFPANLNVAAALALAGIGPDRTFIELWADPTVTRNVHSIEVQADAANLELKVWNVPSDNPRTGQMTVLSVIALLKKLVSPLRVGT